VPSKSAAKIPVRPNQPALPTIPDLADYRSARLDIPETLTDFPGPSYPNPCIHFRAFPDVAQIANSLSCPTFARPSPPGGDLWVL